MKNLIQTALGLEDNAQAMTTIKDAQIPEGKDNMVVLDGALSTIYAKALNAAYAKVDPLSGQPQDKANPPAPEVDTKAGSGVSVESQALDYYDAAQSMKSDGGVPKVKTEGDQIVNVYTYGTQEKPVTPQEVVQVVQELTSAEVPSDFVFVTGAMGPTDQSPLGGATHSMVAIESFTIIVKTRAVESKA